MAIGVKSIITAGGEFVGLGNSPIGFFDTDRNMFNSYDGVIRIPLNDVATVELWDGEFMSVNNFTDDFIQEFDGCGL